MPARRIAERFVQERTHRCSDCGIDRRARVVVEIDHGSLCSFITKPTTAPESERHNGNRYDRPAQPEEIRNESGTDGADGVAQISPEPVHAERAGAPARVCDIRNHGEQARIDHRRTNAEQQAADEPPAELTARRGQKQADRLHPHAGDDQALATPAVAQRTGDRLKNGPDRRIGGLENADPLDAQTERGEVEREDSPAHAVVEIVDEPGLRSSEQVAVADRREAEDLRKLSDCAGAA